MIDNKSKITELKAKHSEYAQQISELEKKSSDIAHEIKNLEYKEYKDNIKDFIGKIYHTHNNVIDEYIKVIDAVPADYNNIKFKVLSVFHHIFLSDFLSDAGIKSSWITMDYSVFSIMYVESTEEKFNAAYKRIIENFNRYGAQK